MISRLQTFTLFALTFICTTQIQASDPRPNILFLFADDWGKYASIYNTLDGGNTPNSVVKTPNFDRLAKEGVLFTQAYVNAPSCTPCRSALLSGQYFYRTGRGAILQGAVWDQEIPSFPKIVRDSGYHIGQTYKVWSPGTPADAPFGQTDNKYEKAGIAFNNFSENVMEAAPAEREAVKEKLYSQVEANFRTFLNDRDKTPFIYWFGPTNVHRAWAKGSGKELWGINPDDLQGKLPPFWPDNAVIREDVADYLGEIQAWDTAVGRLLKMLKETGEYDNTLIIMSGDHGIPGMPRGKCTLYDTGTHVSLAICWKNKIQGGRIVDDFVNMMDMAPTILAATGNKIPEVMTGKSLLHVLLSDKQGQVDPTRTYVVTGRERHVAEANDGQLPYPMRAIRTKDYLYIRNFSPDRWPLGEPTRGLFDIDGGPTRTWYVEHASNPEVKPFWDLAFGKRPNEELYDMQNDPHQMHNLAQNIDPAIQTIKNQLSKKLLLELVTTEDPRILGDGSTFDKMPYTITNEKKFTPGK
jgi:arylsulfatase A-like enzyme